MYVLYISVHISTKWYSNSSILRLSILGYGIGYQNYNGNCSVGTLCQISVRSHGSEDTCTMWSNELEAVVHLDDVVPPRTGGFSTSHLQTNKAQLL